METLAWTCAILLSQMVSGQMRKDMKIGHITVSLMKETALHISRKFYAFSSGRKQDTNHESERVAGGISIPPLCGTVLSCKPEDTLGIQVRPILNYYTCQMSNYVYVAKLIKKHIFLW